MNEPPPRRESKKSGVFRMPEIQTMVSRKSSITNAFVNAVIPTIMPSSEEVAEALAILGIDPNAMECVYCGNAYTEWDHLRPLVVKFRPTGYVSEIANLVPCCGKCNQSKGNKPWKQWITGNKAKHSPTTRNVPDLSQRIQRLEAFEQWREPVKVDFEAVLGKEPWSEYWKLWDSLIAEMRLCQEVADELRKKVMSCLESPEPSFRQFTRDGRPP